MDVLVAGAEIATVRWHTMRDASELEEAASMAQAGSLFVALEYPHGHFLRNAKDARGPEEIARLAESLGLGLVFILDAGDEGTLRALPASTAPRWVQGAPQRLVGSLQDMGFAGALVAPSELPAETSE